MNLSFNEPDLTHTTDSKVSQYLLRLILNKAGVVASGVNKIVVKNQNDPERRAIALAWLFHLVGDIHQSLHAAQLFTVDYPQGDRAGMKSVSG